MAEKEVKEAKNTYELVEVPTETALVIKDNENNKVMNQMEALVLILNELAKIKKALV